MDIDSIWERHGHFLIIENKRPGEKIRLGALITLRALNALPGFTVWIVRGNPPRDIVAAAPIDGDEIPCDAAWLRAQIEKWWHAQ